MRAQLHLPVHTAPGLPGAVSDEESIVKFLPSSEIMCKLPPLKLEHDHKMQFGHDLVPLQSLDLSDELLAKKIKLAESNESGHFTPGVGGRVVVVVPMMLRL